MDIILSRLTQLEEQARLQAASITLLKATNEVQLGVNARLSSENISLKLEVNLLRRTNEDQDKVIGELSRTSIPGGFWVWESRGEGGRVEEEGRWLWSLEKYKVIPAPNVESGPPASLLSPPNDLLNTIVSLLPRTSRLSLLRVSFRLLEIASTYVYKGRVMMGGKEAAKFVESRVAIVHGQPAKSERISRLLVPNKLELDWDEMENPPSPSTFKKLARLLATTQRRISLDINVVTVTLFLPSDLSAWAVLLRLLNPKSFQLWVGEYGHGFHAIPPTVRYVPQDLVESFASQWTRLEVFASLGPESLLLVEGTKSTSAFEACLRRCSPDLPFVQADLWMKSREGVETLEPVDEENLSGSFWKGEVGRYDSEGSWMSLDLRMRKTRR